MTHFHKIVLYLTAKEKHMETSTKSAGEQKVSIRLLLAGGAIGPLLFIVVFLIEGATRPHYSVWQDAVSALSLG
jgi:hypothetical protein